MNRMRLGYVFAPLGAAYGIGLLVGGDDRFFSPAFGLLRDIMPWWGWGLVFIVYAAVLAWSVETRWDWAAMLIGAAPWCFVVASYFSAAVQNEGISIVGATLYSVLVLEHLGSAVGYYRIHREEYAV